MLVLLATGVTGEAATLTSVRAAIEISADGDCDVRMHFAVSSDRPLTSRHTLLFGTAAVDDLRVSGADAGEIQRVSRALAVPIALAAGTTEYAVRYRVRGAAGSGRCALLVPDVPTDGLSRVVQLETTLPTGVTRLPGEFPALAWQGTRGTVTLGHLPAFAATPYTTGEIGWRESFDLRRTLDTVAIGILLGATVIWVASRRLAR